MRRKDMEDRHMTLLPRHIVEGRCSMREFMDCINALGEDVADLPVDDYLVVMGRVVAIMLVGSQMNPQTGKENDLT